MPKKFIVSALSKYDFIYDTTITFLRSEQYATQLLSNANRMGQILNRWYTCCKTSSSSLRWIPYANGLFVDDVNQMASQPKQCDSPATHSIPAFQHSSIPALGSCQRSAGKKEGRRAVILCEEFSVPCSTFYGTSGSEPRIEGVATSIY